MTAISNGESGASVRAKLNASLAKTDATSGTNTGDQDLAGYQLKPVEGAFIDGDKAKLDGVETNATADQADTEIETAYNAQVGQVSAGEITAGTETGVRRFSPADVKSVVDTHGAGGGGGGLTSAQVFRQSLQTMNIRPAEFTYSNDGTYGSASKTDDEQNLISIACASGSGAFAIATREPRSTGSTNGIWNRANSDSGADFSKEIRIGMRLHLRAVLGAGEVIRIKFGNIDEKAVGDLVLDDQAVCAIIAPPASGMYPDVYLQHADGTTLTTSSLITQSEFFISVVSSSYIELVINNGDFSMFSDGVQIGSTQTGVYSGLTSDSDFQIEQDKTAGTGSGTSYVSAADVKFYAEKY